MISQERKIKQNEVYFSNVLDIIGEGKAFLWKDLGEVLVKKEGKFLCSQKAYDKAKEIVSQWFLENKFELKK